MKTITSEAAEKVFIAGHNGLLGRSVYTSFKNAGYLVSTRNRNELDLTNPRETLEYLSDIKPEGLVLCAARVGGIGENSNHPLEMILENIKLQNSVLHAAKKLRIPNLVFVSSAAVYPEVNVYSSENDIFTGFPSPDHIQYALAKISGMEFVNLVRRTENLSWISVIPNNIYGENDSWNLEKSHVIASLIMNIVNSKLNGDKEIMVWGSGKASRSFIHADDAANAILAVYKNIKKAKFDKYNIGSTHEISIENLVKVLTEICKYKGKITFDPSKPEGPRRRMLNTDRLMDFIDWNPSVSFNEGLIRCVYRYEEIVHNSRIIL